MNIVDLNDRDRNELKSWYQFSQQTNSKSTILNGYYDFNRLNWYKDMGIITWGIHKLDLNNEYAPMMIIVITFTDDGLELIDAILSFEKL